MTTGRILRNGVPWRAAGVNIFHLAWNDYPTPAMTSKATIDALLDKAVTLKAGLIRAHTLGISIGAPGSAALVQGITGTTTPVITYNAAAWDTIDYAIAGASSRGLYLMVPMTDELGYYHGGKRNWVNHRRPGTCSTDFNVKSANTPAERAAENYFYSDPQIITDFKTYISDWLGHVNGYTGRANKAEPAVAVIETANEIWTADDYRSWTPMIAQHIKSVAPNVLVADGMAADGSGYWASLTPPQSAVSHIITDEALASPHVDIVGIHPYSAFTAADVTAAATRARGAGKAFLVGEYPWSKAAAPDVEAAVRAAPNALSSMPWSLQVDADLHNQGAAYGTDDVSLYVPGKDPTQTAAVARLQAHGQSLRGA